MKNCQRDNSNYSDSDFEEWETPEIKKNPKRGNSVSKYRLKWSSEENIKYCLFVR